MATTQKRADGCPAEVITCAVHYGWRILPVAAAGKRPLVTAWPKVATCDKDQIRAWTAQYSNCNWGVATGRGSGIFVLDVDGEPGEASLLAFREQDWELPKTLTVTTGRGRHLYFRWPAKQIIRNPKVRPGLDIRGEGGMVVIPPSTHPSGARYTFAGQGAPIVEAPQWLLNIIALPSSDGMNILYKTHRNDGMIRLAGALWRRGVSKKILESDLLAANLRRCRPPLSERHMRTMAAWQAQKPRGDYDILDTAWMKVQQDSTAITYERKTVQLIRHLQLARPDFPIALPLVRISKLMGCSWELVRSHVKHAVADGAIRQVKRAIPKRMAALFSVVDIRRSRVYQ